MPGTEQLDGGGGGGGGGDVPSAGRPDRTFADVRVLRGVEATEAAAIARHAGARHVVITDVNEYRLNLAKQIGVTRAVNVAHEKLADMQAELGMDEGFDVGLEMSGNPSAFNDMLENMCHGGKIAMLGIPEKEMAIDWNTVVFNMLTIKGIYGREMYETWYKMTVMLEGGLDIKPVITHRFGFEEFEKGFETALSGESGKVILEW